MPIICYFSGLYISMYYFDSKSHHLPHIHVNFSEMEAVYLIENTACIEGFIPPAKHKLLIKWIELNKVDLMYNWENAVVGKPVMKIKPLK